MEKRKPENLSPLFVRIPEPLYRWAKVEAARRRVSLAKLIAEALEAYRRNRKGLTNES